MSSTVWRKSSYSGANDNCVEVALGPVVGVRDTKARRAGQLTVSARAWRSVLDRLAQDSGSHR
ncbi:DUF397 domain-containing protein [Amycolatopsis sp. NPDC051716]|uniref:DUF397 domain-containing protein n=1 Tax=Amycolatopsis sp. NPDC051716 TaxID=3155804 RepID=UPI00341F1E17